MILQRATMTTIITVLAVSVLLVPAAFAKNAAPEQPAGDPPYGVALQRDAAGIKLSGVLFIEYHDFSVDAYGVITADARVVLRLRNDKEVFAFYAEVPNVPWLDPAVNQMLITEQLECEVLDTIFPENGGGCAAGLEINLKNVSDYGSVDTGTTLTGSPFSLGAGTGSSFVLIDVVVAVK